jgi:hypothetical protein
MKKNLDELMGMRRVLLFSFLSMVVGAADVSLALFTTMEMFHPLRGAALLVASIILFRFIYKKTVNLSGSNKDRKDKKLKNDGWEYLGDNYFCTTRFRDFSNPGENKNNLEKEGWVHLGNGMYCRKQDIEDRDAEREMRAKADAYWKKHGFKKP